MMLGVVVGLQSYHTVCPQSDACDSQFAVVACSLAPSLAGNRLRFAVRRSALTFARTTTGFEKARERRKHDLPVLCSD